MGNGHGKPVVFTDEGAWRLVPAWRLMQVGRQMRFGEATRGLADRNSQPSRPYADMVLPLTDSWPLDSEPQPLSTVACGGKGCLWKGPDSGAEGHRPDLCVEIHTER